MSNDDQQSRNPGRRNFLKTIGAAGVGSLLGTVAGGSTDLQAAADNGRNERVLPHIPKRILGKTGVAVPCLSHGLMYDLVDNQIILHRALPWGVTMWDTAYSYANGNSELGVGKFLKRRPEVRKDLFLVTKASGARTVKDLEARLQASLKRMNTSYVDLYYGVHGLHNPAGLTRELRD